MRLKGSCQLLIKSDDIKEHARLCLKFELGLLEE